MRKEKMKIVYVGNQSYDNENENVVTIPIKQPEELWVYIKTAMRMAPDRVVIDMHDWGNGNIDKADGY